MKTAIGYFILNFHILWQWLEAPPEAMILVCELRIVIGRSKSEEGGEGGADKELLFSSGQD